METTERSLESVETRLTGSCKALPASLANKGKAPPQKS